MHRQSFHSQPVANAQSVVAGPNYRFTVLTDGLIRYEWAEDNEFEDRPSVFAVCRSLPTPEFRVKETDSSLEILTSRFHLTYDKEPFSSAGLSVLVKGKNTFWCHASIWRYGESSSDLGGTARTLDDIDGRTKLDSGVISKRGFAHIDDSKSMLFDEEGFAASRLLGNRNDGYLFAYGHDYRAAVKALYQISGPQPLLPRWALGNWWSRYYAYTTDEYLSLLDKFEEERIPLTVAVLDMDWHLTDDQRVIDSGATGWTGYTWNKKLYPDPPAFLAELHRKKLKITLNDHPAEGVYAYEDSYEEMCKAVGHDSSSKDPVAFDLTDRRFLDATFDILHRKLEDEGVDFWWLDWQQGSHSKLKGIDPLWLLNHYTFLDSGRGNRRPLTFSRYAGPGSHRYPVGFSGDTIVTWDSLNFQPEFTATSSNIGYGWWSHDIGGHMGGSKDDALATRWVQFGVFSPIMRLHSSISPWTSKEPWNFGKDAQETMNDFLRFRHRLLPYLYTMNANSPVDGTPLVQPMYWSFPENREAYEVPNQYLFGSELIVMPITTPQDPSLLVGRVKGWFPPGRHVDIFNGAVYEGDRQLWINRSIDTMPVFAREGSIIPLDAVMEPENGGENPTSLEVLVAVGADGSFEMKEDDGVGTSVEEVGWIKTPFTYLQETGTLEAGPTTGPISLKTRDWSFRFLGISSVPMLKVIVDGHEQEFSAEKVANGTLVKIGSHPTSVKISITIGNDPKLEVSDPAKMLFPFINKAQFRFELKEKIWAILTAKVSRSIQISRLHTLDMDQNRLNAILEYMY